MLSIRQASFGDKTLIEQLVGIAIEDLAVDAGFQVLGNAKSKISPELLKQFQQKLQSLSSEKLFIDFTGENYTFYESIQMTFTDDGKGDGYIPKMVLNNCPELLRRYRQRASLMIKKRTG